MGFLHVVISGQFPSECFITEVTADLSSLMFLLLVSFEDGLGGEILTTHRADLPLVKVLGLDMSLKVVARTSLNPTKLTDQARPGPGVFAPPVSRKVPLTLS